VKQTLRGGAEVDMLTHGELEGALRGLREWMVSAVQGARPVRFSAQATITAAGDLVLGQDERSGATGPDQGFVWIVRRVAVQGLAVAADPTEVYVTDVLANQLVYAGLTGSAWSQGYKAWNSGELVLQGNDRIVVANGLTPGGIGSAGVVTLTGAALAFPVGLAWRYLS